MPELPEVISQLDNTYFKSLKNRHISNPRLGVFFSGGNAVGKSTLAQKIRDDLSALVIENDAIREAVSRHSPNLSILDRNEYMWQYTLSLYKRLPEMTPNGLVVRDATIDRSYEQVFPIFGKLGYEIFTVGFDVSREKRVELIKQRGDKNTIPMTKLLEIIDRYEDAIKRFRENNQVDVTLTEENLFDHQQVINLLQEKIKVLKS